MVRIQVNIPHRLIPKHGEAQLKLQGLVEALEMSGFNFDRVFGIRTPNDIFALITVGGYAAKPGVFGTIVMVSSEQTRSEDNRAQFGAFVSTQIKNWLEPKIGFRPEVNLVVQLVDSVDYIV